MNKTEAAKRDLCDALLRLGINRADRDDVMQAIEKLVEAKLDDFDDLLRQRQP